MKKKWMIFLFIIFVLSFIKADTTEINPGGDITPYGDIEKIPSCTPLYTCSGLSYTCGFLDDGCGGVICGTCNSGYTCSAGTCAASEVTPAPTPGSAPSGGALPSSITLEIFPREFNIRMAINTNQPETIRIINLGTEKKILSISEENLEDKIIISSKLLTINPGESKDLKVIFVAPSEPGIYNGSIFIGDKEIPVILNVKVKNLLFDSNILVLNRNYKVSKEGTLKTKVTLVPMGDKERLDVQLNYLIRDSSGKIYVAQTETVLIENKINFEKDFDIGGLPLGKYVIELKLVYPGGIAPSSSDFEIVEKTVSDFISESVFNLIVLILLLSIIIIFAIIKRVNQTGIEAEQVIL